MHIQLKIPLLRTLMTNFTKQVWVGKCYMSDNDLGGPQRSCRSMEGYPGKVWDCSRQSSVHTSPSLAAGEPNFLQRQTHSCRQKSEAPQPHPITSLRWVLTGWNILSFFLPLGFAAFSILPFIPWSSLDLCSIVPILVKSVPSASAGLALGSRWPVVSASVSSCPCRMVQFGQI